MYTDETLTCIDCRRSFTFTANEQEFYASKGFTNKPSRCGDCRAARKASGGGRSRGDSYSSVHRAREMFKATCSQCGGVAEIPFQPRGDRPVYCRDCFARRQS